MNKNRILVVDDEPKMVRLIHEVMCACGFDVITASNGEQAIEMAAMEQPSLILLDLILTGSIDGYEVARRLREFCDTPIIMLTARVRESDKLKGFEVGADDYITKPFSSKELLARVRAVLKRSQGEVKPAAEAEIFCSNLKIDLARRRVMVYNEEVHLTPTEYELLHELVIHRNQVLSHEQLLTAVWGPEYRDDLDYLRTYIRYLRHKIEKDPAKPKMIVRCPGVGYMFSCPEGS